MKGNGLLLASQSPRRKRLLALAGWAFRAAPADLDERLRPGEAPRGYVERLAESKARAAIPRATTEGFVVGADTIVVDEGEILGKPADPDEAEATLRRLRGRRHEVYTALTVFRLADRARAADVCVTAVPMRPYTDAEMRTYIATGDPFDKAGGYAIQHSGFRPVTGLDGCHANVVGLPLCLLARLLQDLGHPPENDFQRAVLPADPAECPACQLVREADL